MVSFFINVQLKPMSSSPGLEIVGDSWREKMTAMANKEFNLTAPWWLPSFFFLNVSIYMSIYLFNVYI